MRLALTLVSLILLAGCGGDDSKEPADPTAWPSGIATSVSPGSTPGSEFMPPNAKESAAALSKCSEVWVAGKSLPSDYSGCQTEDGGLDRGAVYDCTDGKGQLIGYNDEFFARLGGTISAYGEDDAAFSRELFEVCKPEQ
ncbi:MAG TPA: hypothetical protein VJ782_03485 [Aeromicrobium sp.]|nr:hypothetical protein [Aeromicrobium sp.]